MIVFRQVDARYPFLWEDAQQAPGRWHAAGDGPAHYFADTPDGAWAEFLRHEEITEAEDVLTIRRQLWAVDIGDAPAAAVSLPIGVLTGGPATYARCQQEARALRAGGAARIVAPSAALVAGGASGFRVHEGARSAPPRDARVIVVFGSPGDITGWIAAEDARPPVALLDRVRQYRHGSAPR